MNQDAYQLYINLFVNRTDVWFRQWIDSSGKCQYSCMKPETRGYEPVTPTLIEKHLSGEVTASWPATDSNGMSKWCCWDHDSADGSLLKIAAVLEGAGLHPLFEGRRPGRDGHLWLLFDRPVDANHLIRLNEEVMVHAGVPIHQVEFFPKSATKSGQVRGPLGVHRKPEAANTRGWFEDAPKDVEHQLQWLAIQRPNNSCIITRLAHYLLARDYQAMVRPIQQATADRQYQQSFTAFSIFDYGSSSRKVGHELAAPCPLCVREGHDKHGDNLRISHDGKFNCVFGGPNEIHKVPDIIQALQY